MTRIEQPRAGRAGLGTWLVGLAAAFTVGCLVLSAWLVSSPGGEEGEAPPAGVRASPPSGPARPPVATRPHNPFAVAPPAPGQQLPLEESEAALREATMEEKTGIALFVPGTKPIKRGIVVPEGFELPPGYVRHYQTTDSGQMLEAILMFHPDHTPLDAEGKPVPVPENRVVPPELAPPGLPIVMLEVPEGPESGAPPR